jgi:hypothetical protein
MQKKLLIWLLVFVGIVSCSEEAKNRRRVINKKYKQDLINYSNCFTDNENRLSFPICFNDSLIRQNRIASITRSFFRNDTVNGDKEASEVRTYSFDDNGLIDRVKIVQIYEHSPVSTIEYSYPDGVDEFGFGDVKFENKKELELSGTHYEIFLKEEYADKFLVYSEESSGDYLFYMKNSINWGTVSVDSILHPTPDDIVAYGTPEKPVKQYRVENKVNEFEVNTVEYIGKNQVVNKLTFNRYPFEYHRTLRYGKSGFCSGFVDSTFTSDQFLIRRTSSIKRNDNGLPIEVIHENDTEDHKGYKEIEKFEYEFRKD